MRFSGAGTSVTLAFFADSTWVMDGELHYAFEPEAILQNRNEFASILSHDGAETDSFSDRLLQQYEARYLQIKAFARADKDVHIPWYFYPSVERKALRTRNMQQAHCPEDEAVVHLVHNQYFQGRRMGRAVPSAASQLARSAGYSGTGRRAAALLQ